MKDSNFPTFKVTIVAPVHIQPSEEWVSSLEATMKGKTDVKVIIVDDSDGKVVLPGSFDVYGYDRQRETMGDDPYKRFEMFHKSAACKSFGIWKAWWDKADVIIVIDSDCIVPPNFVSKHLEGLMMKATGWTNPLKNIGWFPRGYPMSQRELPVALSMGLWNNELDLYGFDRVERGNTPPPELGHTKAHEVADGFVPLSGMNIAFWSRCAPALCFLPNFEYTYDEVVHKFRRHDDIWGGYIFQALMAKANERLVYGDPVVFHDTIVVPEEDAAEEVDAIAFEEAFYNQVDLIIGEIDPADYDIMYDQFSSIVQEKWKDTEWEPLACAMDLWVDLFV